jgi:rhomboid protease GluP
LRGAQTRCMMRQMIDSDFNSAPLEPEAAPEPELVPVGTWHSLGEASEHALVVLAMNLECWIMPWQGNYAVLADPAHAGAIRHEYELYAAEQSHRQVQPADHPLFPAGLDLFFAWMFSLLGTFLWQLRDESLSDRFCNSSLAVVDGKEWWRPFTSLFLHADAGHLLGNIAIGGIFCIMVAKVIGAWRAWPLILLAGTLANFLNAWLRYPDSFLSLGASTATFGALGILIGHSTRLAWQNRSYREFRPLVAPLLAGGMMLAWWGTSGENTDVAGHFLGTVCGMLLGLLSVRKDASMQDLPQVA